MRTAVIVSAVRTPIGSFRGNLSELSAVDLGSIVIKESIKRAGIAEADVDEVIMGNVLQAGLGQNPARQAAFYAGLSENTSAWTVNKVCGSGLKSIICAAQAIQCGDSNIVVAGGMESMSNSPYILTKAREGYRMGDGKLIDSMIHDGLTDAFYDIHMGLTAENIAEQYNISREEQDQYALLSQQRAEDTIKKGLFTEEIVPVPVSRKKQDPVIVDQDEYPRVGLRIDELAKLRPAFRANGTVTAGNASGINDGAAAVILMSREEAERLEIEPIATIKAYSSVSLDPRFMGLGPVEASRKALRKAGLSIEDIDIIEANEAFSVQALAVAKELKLDINKTNINGGAIALGHPIGASGTRILVTLLHELKRKHARYGLATLCIGGGQGVSLIVEGSQT
ncbi:acetyl-CoA acetyltransferase [Desulfitobacterium hafniense]|uniref:Acetyl-CoA acetyltransferase n=1 Tax=Desulfitobacterium hafniense TaxID=49338 RepID=A0A0W1JRP4_DESHA|nr:acetyl-CoA C-acetyltransferase [Desulfitobacterium hafniense]KTE93848.1 acetyl-CoA acetyltransferase [Desulfitobacterium hafniense]